MHASTRQPLFLIKKMLTFLVLFLFGALRRVDTVIIESRYVNISWLVVALNHGILGRLNGLIALSIGVDRGHIDCFLLSCAVALFVFLVINNGDLVLIGRSISIYVAIVCFVWLDHLSCIIGGLLALNVLCTWCLAVTFLLVHL